jgi:electron transfer flavoprotein beta subunit
MEVQIDGGSLRVKRELEGGWFQWIAMPLPALLTIPERHQPASLRDVEGHHGGEKERNSQGHAPDGLEATQQIVGLRCRRARKQTQMISGSPADAAKGTGSRSA